MKKIILIGGAATVAILAIATGVFVLTSPDIGQTVTESGSGVLQPGAPDTVLSETDLGTNTGTDTVETAATAPDGAGGGTPVPIEIASAPTDVLAPQEVPSVWRREFELTDFSVASVNFGTILSGGPQRDGIPAIDNPRFGTVADGGEFMADTEPVITLAHGGEVKAYPLSILMYHEIVNDEIGGTPVAVTFCPLCNSTIVFRAELDGQILDFGTTGRLRNSDLVMYDRQTESWWQQFTGEGIVGTHTGRRLEMLPARVESFATFRDRHPDGAVLLVPEGSRRSYGINPYYEYDQIREEPGEQRLPFLFGGALRDDIPPLAYVVAVGDRAWALTLLREAGRVETEDGLIIEWTPGLNSALDRSQISDGYDIGSVTVQRMEAGALIDVVHDVSFVFAHHAFYPDGEIIQ